MVIRRWIDFTELVVCPTCHAKATETCRTVTGHTTTPHTTRLLTRRCRCGAVLAPRRRYCDECRDEALQASKNEWARLKRQGYRSRWAGEE